MMTSSSSSSRLPSLFLAHGAPPLLDDAVWMGQLADWAKALPRPTALLVISAHWTSRPITVGATTPLPLIYDFYGFPQRFYELQYTSPGAPALAKRVHELLGGTQAVQDAPTRGLDHGVYVPLMAMYPKADIPVLQLSIPTMDPATLIEVGKKLAPLREEGVLIVGSGFIVHNLRAIDPSGRMPLPSWAAEFDAWVAEAVQKRDVDALLQYRAKAPGVDMSLPTHEHFVPLLVSLGSSLGHSEDVSFPILGTWFGGFTKRSVQFG